MKHFDKENLIVIGIALAVLIAWGVWYPQRQAKVNAKNKGQYAAAQALAAKNAAAQKYADRQAEKKAAEKPAAEKPLVSQPAPAPNVPVPPAPLRKKVPPVILSNELALFTIDPNYGTIDRIELKKYDTSDRKERIVYSSEQVPRKTFALEGLENWQFVDQTVLPEDSGSSLRTIRNLAAGKDMLRITEQFSLLPNSYSLDLKITLTNPGSGEVILPLFRVWAAGIPTMEQFAGDNLNGRIMHRIEYCPSVSKKMVSLDPAMKEEKFIALDLNQPTDWVAPIIAPSPI